jgi:hypothetical protein
MPKQVVVSLWIEIAMITVTMILLVQPRMFFPFRSTRARLIGNWGGMMLLCMTFCWSVILGCILALNDMTFQL